MSVAQRHHRDPGRLRPLDAEQCRVAGDDLAIAALAVIDDDRAGVADHPPRLVRLRLAGGEVAQIAGDHADPVAVMPLQIGLDQMAGDDAGLLLAAAAGGEYPVRDAGQLVDGDHWHVMTPFWRSAWISSAV
jgi:hypothetical protein